MFFLSWWKPAVQKLPSSTPQSAIRSVGPPPAMRFTNLFDYGNRSNVLQQVAGYTLPNGHVLTICVGLTFELEGENGAIVVATDEMLSDNDVLTAAGSTLRDDCAWIPLVKNTSGELVKCRTGSARIVGPNHYGNLNVPFIIYAVGPDFNNDKFRNNACLGKLALKKAYWSALSFTKTKRIKSVALPLISAGIHRGKLDTFVIISVAVSAIKSWCTEPRVATDNFCKDIVLFASSTDEAAKMIDVCDVLLSGQYKIYKL